MLLISEIVDIHFICVGFEISILVIPDLIESRVNNRAYTCDILIILKSINEFIIVIYQFKFIINGRLININRLELFGHILRNAGKSHEQEEHSHKAYDNRSTKCCLTRFPVCIDVLICTVAVSVMSSVASGTIKIMV